MINITPISLNELYVYWDGIKGDYFQILRSGSPEDDFEIVEAHSLGPFFVDSDVNLYDPSIRYYYKIIGYSGGVVVGEETPTTSYYHKGDPIANKVIHESKVVLRVMDNPFMYVLLRKRDGKDCPECWNTVTKKVRYAGCKVCNGTGKMEGYYPSIPIRVSQNVTQLAENSNMVDGDNVSNTPIDAWTINYPLLSPGDVLVDRMNQRFSLDQVQKRTKNQFVMRQLMQLYPLPKGHPSYNAKVDFEEVPRE